MNGTPATREQTIGSRWAPADEVDLFDATTRLVAVGTVALAGYRLPLAGGVSAALLVVAALTPVWWGAVWRSEFIVAIAGMTVFAIFVGIQLAEATSLDHVVSSSAQHGTITHLAGGLAITVAMLWARALVPLHVVATAYGVGALADALLNSAMSWKFDLALPVTIVVVGWLGKYQNRAFAAAAFVVLGLATALDQGRSFFAFAVVSACLVMWELRPTAGSGRTWRWSPALLLAAFSAATYQIATSLLIRGYFGADAQERTVNQLETSGSVIAGGRPEWSVTRELVRARPQGYGLGVVPNSHDLGLGLQGFASINLEADGYLKNYMMNGGFRLHSIAADLWVSCGVAGLVLALTIGFALVRTLSALSARRVTPPLAVFAVVLAVWHLAFGPIYTNWPDVCFALGLVLLPRR